MSLALARPQSDYTKTHSAAHTGHSACLRRLLAGALGDDGQNTAVPVDQRDSGGMTPLLWACRAAQAACASVLVEAGADVTLADEVLCRSFPVSSALLS